MSPSNHVKLDTTNNQDLCVVMSARRTFTGVAVINPPHVEGIHLPSLLTTVFFVKIQHSGHNTRTVIGIMMVRQGTMAEDVLEDSKNAIHQHTKDMIIIHLTALTPHQIAETHQTWFMRLAANVTSSRMSKNIVKHSVQQTLKVAHSLTMKGKK